MYGKISGLYIDTIYYYRAVNGLWSVVELAELADGHAG
jgi:hypothetical protein